MNTMSENSFLSTINSITRANNGMGTCIDHIFLKSKDELDFIIPFIIETDISNHYTIAVQIIFSNKCKYSHKLHVYYKEKNRYEQTSPKFVTN